MADTTANTLEKASDLGKTPQAVQKRWVLELKLAGKREESWRKKASEIYKLYTPETPANNSFNILWTNTETLRQSVYNSLPQPDVRRRYSDEDPIGKAVGEVLTRSLEFAQDTYDFDGLLKADVLAMLLPGRAVSRVRYIPDIKTVGGDIGEQDAGTDEESQETESYEEIEWEQVVCERVQWDDFRILCAAKTWEEVNAIGFRHRLTREDCIDKFGEEIGNAIPLDSVEDEDVKKSKDVSDLFKTAEVWEIWDKEEKQVLFICPTYPKPCKIQDDPLELQGFFPIPRPLYAIESDISLVPACIYTQYEQQAKELNKISTRINKLVDALKVRGVYDATLTELSELMKGGDNDLIAAQNVTALLERGGLDKAIWMMPIDTAAMVLKELYVQRDASKQVIYEITGISDIMRSASDPNETFGAQKIKTQWGTQRLQRMQKEVQRYIRDLIRLKAEVIAEKFQPETLQAMTLLNYPHQHDLDIQYQQAVMQWQQQAMMAQQQGQPAPQQPQPPSGQLTWEAVIEAMHNDATRTYRVDIETDSTLSATQDGDMSGLKDVLGGVGQIMQAMGPWVQQGAMPIEAVKALILSVTRRAKMGSAVEDALEKMQQPQPQPDPNAAKAQADAQQSQAKIQADMQMQQGQQQHEAQLEQFKAQLADQQHQREMQYNAQNDEASGQRTMQLEQWKQEMQARQVQHQNELEAQRELQRQQLEAASEQRKHEQDSAMEAQRIAFEQWKVEFTESTKIVVAQISAKTTMDSALLSAQQAADSEVAESVGSEDDKIAQAMGMHTEALGKIGEVMQQMAKPKKRTLVTNEDGSKSVIEE